MAIDTSTLEATLQSKFDTVTDPKEMLLLGKAYEATVGGIAVSDIEDAGAAQVAAIEAAATSIFPDQTGNAGEFLTTDGSNLSWDTVNTTSDMSLLHNFDNPTGSQTMDFNNIFTGGYDAYKIIGTNYYGDASGGNIITLQAITSSGADTAANYLYCMGYAYYNSSGSTSQGVTGETAGNYGRFGWNWGNSGDVDTGSHFELLVLNPNRSDRRTNFICQLGGWDGGSQWNAINSYVQHKSRTALTGLRFYTQTSTTVHMDNFKVYGIS